MPKLEYSRRPDVRHRDRKKNYEKGRFGKVRRYKGWQKFMVRMHFIPDRITAKIIGSSTNAVQVLRWRVRVNYLGLYG